MLSRGWIDNHCSRLLNSRKPVAADSSLVGLHPVIVFMTLESWIGSRSFLGHFLFFDRIFWMTMLVLNLREYCKMRIEF
jgi:hypothetical protein